MCRIILYVCIINLNVAIEANILALNDMRCMLYLLTIESSVRRSAIVLLYYRLFLSDIWQDHTVYVERSRNYNLQIYRRVNIYTQTLVVEQYN